GAEAGLSAARRRSGPLRRSRLRAVPAAADGRSGPRRGDPGGDRLLPRPPPVAFKRANPQVSRHRVRPSKPAPPSCKMNPPTFEITKAATFDAAHYFAEGPQHRPYSNLHGHSFRVEATVRGQAQEPVGWVADLADLETALKGVAAELDHGLLNEKPG